MGRTESEIGREDETTLFKGKVGETKSKGDGRATTNEIPSEMLKK